MPLYRLWFLELYCWSGPSNRLWCIWASFSFSFSMCPPARRWAPFCSVAGLSESFCLWFALYFMVFFVEVEFVNLFMCLWFICWWKGSFYWLCWRCWCISKNAGPEGQSVLLPLFPGKLWMLSKEVLMLITLLWIPPSLVFFIALSVLLELSISS